MHKPRKAQQPASPPPQKQLLPTVADEMAKLFPWLNGRSLAVSEADITKENMPTLPLCMVALVRVDAVAWNWQAANGKNDLFDDFIVEFWLEPKKEKRPDGAETPFWVFYDYEAFRDRVLSWMVGFVGPRNQRLEFRNLAVESDQYAVVLSFRFRAHYNWCRIEDDDPPSIIGQSAKLTSDISQPRPVWCPEPCEQPKECDACSSP